MNWFGAPNNDAEHSICSGLFWPFRGRGTLLLFRFVPFQLNFLILLEKMDLVACFSLFLADVGGSDEDRVRKPSLGWFRPFPGTRPDLKPIPGIVLGGGGSISQTNNSTDPHPTPSEVFFTLARLFWDVHPFGFGRNQ